MTTKIDSLHDKYLGNAWPTMLDAAAKDLGVSADSLRRLEIGWAPIVNFKKGSNFQGWWVVPERDHTGLTTGLLLRSQSGMKVMYPGSKHGLTFEVNPNHEKGAEAYRPGAHNWVRCNADILCPVCDKPDGCLISSNDIDNPNSVICRVQKDGSDRPQGIGWLHILRAEGHVATSKSVLPESKLPIIIVEGMTDTAAAMDMGFVAIGRPSNLACIDRLVDLVRGRAVIIVGENDKINVVTGRRPGEEGMIATFQVLKDVCNARKVLPPDDVNDLRQWKNKYDLTADEFLEYVENNADEVANNTVIEDDHPLTMAKTFLLDQHRIAGRYTLRSHSGVYYSYKNGRYTYQTDTQVSDPIYQWGYGRYVQMDLANGDTKLNRLKVTLPVLHNMMAALSSECRIKSKHAPCWINDAMGPDPRYLITFSNGIMDYRKYLEGGEFAEYMMDPSPDLFTLAAMPFDFDPDAKCPTFKKWARSSLGDDFDKIKLMQEFTGYCLTADTTYQKMLWMKGRPAAGKSLYLKTLRFMVGEEQYASISLQNLSGRFGLGTMVGKQVAAIADLRMGSEKLTALETILKIVGGDPVTVERKYEHAEHSVEIGARFLVSSNFMPQFQDPTGALKRRLLLLEFNRTFEKREDRTLEDKFRGEVQGIAVWALEGLRRLTENTQFTTPESMQEVLDEWHQDNSPVSSFIEDCVIYEDHPETWMKKEEVLAAFREWCRERDIFTPDVTSFKQLWMERAPSFVKSRTVTFHGRKVSVYTGIVLEPWAKKAYLGTPTNS